MIAAALLVPITLAFAPGLELAPEKPAARPAAITGKPPSERDVEAALKRGIAALVECQESYAPKGETAAAEKREWPYEGVYRVKGAIPIGYRIGGTSIVAMALIEASAEKPAAPVRAAIERGLDFVLEGLGDARMSAEFVEGYDVRGWGHAYALGFLLRLRSAHLVPEKRAAEVEAAIDALVPMLQTTQIRGRGGWNYSRPAGDDSDASTFMTAPTLQFLFEARRQGETVDAQVVERGLQSLEDARLATGAFQYGSDKKAQNGKGFEDVPGAIGRMAACEVTLLLAGRGSVDRVRGSLDAFFEHWEWLEKRRKQDGTHVPPYMIAPYYFFYAHRHAAQAIEFLPEAERAGYRAKLNALLWQVREKSGGWNDRVFPRSEAYGTAMTLLALREPSLPRPAGWSAPAKTGE
jgi:hypothetical protein